MDKGSTIGHYEIIRTLGQGGMGEVYLAEDTKLQRQVALKFLPESVRADADRLARFRHEALAAASLKHPNIATIYALEDVDDHTFIAMEYLEGEELSSRIASGGMDLDVFFGIFIPLAEALAHAHEQGRIHRDIKPANIMIAQDGMPKILDFGLARIVGPDANQAPSGSETSDPIDSMLPTQTIGNQEAAAGLTQPGQLMGTPHYMSPEQAERQETDARTDIFSFGVVMYEALTGQKPFDGKTLESTIRRIIDTEPRAATEVRSMTPYQLWSTIRRCLKKEREQRIQTSRELHAELQDVRKEVDTGTALVYASNTEPIRHTANTPGVIKSVSIALLLIIVTATLSWYLRPIPDAPLRKYQLVDELDERTQLAISPDGTMIAYIQDERLWIRDLRQLVTREIPDSDGALWYPFWSPDGNHIGYFTRDALKRVPTAGGDSNTISALQLPGGNFFPQAAWGPDGTIVFLFSRLQQVYEVSDRGGESTVVARVDTVRGEAGFSAPCILPDGKGLVLTAIYEDDTWGFIVQDPAGTSHSLSERWKGGGDRMTRRLSYSPSGHLIHEFNDGIRAVPISLANLSSTGMPFLVVQNGKVPSVGQDGSLLYLQYATDQRQNQIIQIPRNGKVVKAIGQLQAGIGNPALSPDDKFVAATGNFGVQGSDIWIHDIDRGIGTRLTTAPGSDVEPIWSRTGDQLMWRRFSGIYIQASDGSGVPERLAGVGAENPSISPDGRYLFYHKRNDNNDRDIWMMNLENGEATPFLQTTFHEGLPEPSPDGRHLAYTSDESGQFEIYLRTFPDGKNRMRVSENGGAYARWNGAGDELYYVEGDRLMAVSIENAPSLTVGNPQQLFTEEDVNVRLAQITGVLIPTYDVSADGQWFIAIRGLEASTSPTITVVQNWFTEFEGQE